MAFSDALTCEVLDTYRGCASDKGTTPGLILQLDPPNIIWEGVSHYHEVTLRIRLDDRRKREEQRRKAGQSG